MNVKHAVHGLVSMVSLTFLAVAGCATGTIPEDEDLLDDAIEATEEEDEESLDTAEDALSSGQVTCSGQVLGGTHKRFTGVVGTDALDKDGAYDVKSICVAEMNKRRRTKHLSYGGKTLEPYRVYNATNNSSYLASYTVATAEVGLDTTTEACRAIADAKVGNHAGYGNPLPGATTAFCPADSSTTASHAISNCMNMIEAESGFFGHQGGLLWDTARPISCAIGVITVNGKKERGVSIGWGTPTKKTDRPNGARCKSDSYCSSGNCGDDGRCKGASGSACPGADSLACSEHPEDPGLCLKKGIACQSGVCKSDKKCQ